MEAIINYKVILTVTIITVRIVDRLLLGKISFDDMKSHLKGVLEDIITQYIA